MKDSALRTLLLLLVLQTLAGAALRAQISNRPFVRKFEVGYPNQSELNSIWPTQNGWWGLFHKIDSTGPGAYYFGAESVELDSSFVIRSSTSYGGSSKYYFSDPTFNPKSFPDGSGNFWYWLLGYTPADTIYHLYYGKIDSQRSLLFEKEIPNTSPYDYFHEFLQLPQGNGLLVNTHSSQFTFVTWLNWVDSLGNVIHLDSTMQIAFNYLHSTISCTYDSIHNVILAPSDDFLFSGYQIYDNRPRISVYSTDGTLQKRKDLTSQLRDNSIGTLYPTDGGGYVARLMEHIYDSTSLRESHRPGIVKLDSNFDVVWKKYLFPRKDVNDAYVFHQSKDGDFYLAGWSDNPGTDTVHKREWFLSKFSPQLDSLWTRFYNIGGDSIHNVTQIPTQMHTLDNGDILLLVDNAGYWPPLGQSIYYTTLYKLDSLGCLIGGCAIGDTVVIPPDSTLPHPKPGKPWPDPEGGIIAYPNPSSGWFSLIWDVYPGDVSQLQVCDVAGRVLQSQELVRSTQPTLLDLSRWAEGVYLLQITSEKGRVFRKKVMVMR